MAAPVQKRATYEDVLAAPPNRIAELIDGVPVFLATHAADARVRAEPFDAVELELGALWADLAEQQRPE